MMVVRLQGKKVDSAIVQIYMSDSGLADQEVEETYDKIEEIVEKEKKGACVILMGDWNAVVGDGEHGRTVGRYGLGKWNERGESLVNFCKRNSMITGNTMFEQHKRRRYTWISPVYSQRYQIDYILIQETFRNCLKNANTLPGADINSDHALLIGEVDIRLKKIRGRQMTKKFDMETLKNEEERRKFQGKFEEKATNLETPFGNSNEYWIHLKRCIQNT